MVAQPVNGTLTMNADGSFVYTPNADFNGTDGFSYLTNDGAGDSQVATVTITVNPVNDDPEAVDDAYSVDEDTTLTVDAATGVLANDTDVDGDTLTAALVSGPANGTLTLNADGSFSYTPNANFNGTDTFTYSVSDGTTTVEATVTITVNAGQRLARICERRVFDRRGHAAHDRGSGRAGATTPMPTAIRSRSPSSTSPSTAPSRSMPTARLSTRRRPISTASTASATWPATALAPAKWPRSPSPSTR